ncbi:olfactory receptor 51B5-like [Gastrophryne carolinensis]
MENVFNISHNFVLLGVVEMKKHKYLYLSFSSIFFLFILVMNGILVFVVMEERSLHEPMYILIASLLFNEIFGCSSFYPKLLADLASSSDALAINNCRFQSILLLTFSLFEMTVFTVMAFDRYLAVCFPLRYAALMTNGRVIKSIVVAWAAGFILSSIMVFLGWNLPLCGDKISNVFCDNMSMVILACVDASVSRMYSAVLITFYLIVTVLVTLFSYLRIFIVCLRLAKESRQKAMHTLVTHILNFFIFLMGFLFVFLRFRLEKITIPIMAHVFLTVSQFLFPPLLNPLIYGIRTHALKIKAVYYMGKVTEWAKVGKISAEVLK